MRVITTIHPYSPFLRKVAAHPIISGVRLNTVMTIKGSLTEYLRHLMKVMGDKEVWIDLKCRQLRTRDSHYYHPAKVTKPRGYKIGDKTVLIDPSTPRVHGELRCPPWTELLVSHKIKIDLSDGPIQVLTNDGYGKAWLVEVIDGDTLVMLDGPKKVVGRGESINIIHPSLEIEGFFTKRDLEFIAAAKEVGLHNYMLSYVEESTDVEALLELDPEANVVAKIESPKGIRWVEEVYPRYGDNVHLMAARGDLYIEMGRPDKILRALQTIAKADPEAIVASRILGSLLADPRPSCADITDIGCLLGMGYEQFMVGDDICFDEPVLMLGLDIMKAIARDAE